jgi:signal transduction histidine kinase
VPTSQLASAATTKLESLLRKSFSLLLIVTTFEVAANALSQASLLNGLSFVFLGLLLLGQAILFFASWFGRPNSYLFTGYGVLSLVLLLFWPFLVLDPALLPSEYQPWMWWAIGSSAVSVAIGAKPLTALFYITLNAVLWFIIDSSAFGGSSSVLLSLQDSTYLFFSAGSLAGLIFLIRDATESADQANSQAIASTLERARTDAVERERQRIDALVHDKVLSTLLLAASAQTAAERKSVTDQAEEAISILTSTQEGTQVAAGFNVLGLFRALRQAAKRLDPDIEVITNSGGSETLSTEVAESLTEATLQAIDNALRHAKAANVKLLLSSPAVNEIQIQVIDDGVGFRIDRVPKDRIGIRLSIYARLESVGGKAIIESDLGKGSSVSLRWSA